MTTTPPRTRTRITAKDAGPLVSVLADAGFTGLRITRNIDVAQIDAVTPSGRAIVLRFVETLKDALAYEVAR